MNCESAVKSRPSERARSAISISEEGVLTQAMVRMPDAARTTSTAPFKMPISGLFQSIHALTIDLAHAAHMMTEMAFQDEFGENRLIQDGGRRSF